MSEGERQRACSHRRARGRLNLEAALMIPHAHWPGGGPVLLAGEFGGFCAGFVRFCGLLPALVSSAGVSGFLGGWQACPP